jgi:hypothetical protein
VPVGVPVDGATSEIVAVKVTGWPKMAGFDEELTAAAVFALFTVRLDDDELLAAKVDEPGV